MEKSAEKAGEKKYLKSYLHEVNTVNAGRLSIAFRLIFVLEFFIILQRIMDDEVFANPVLAAFSFGKLILSSSYTLVYRYYKKRRAAIPEHFHYYVYISLVLLAAIHSYLLYDEVSTVQTIYNHLYLLIILTWAMVYPPSRIMPLFGTVTLLSYGILYTVGQGDESFGNNFFALSVFSIVSPVASYVIYRNHLTAFINKDKLNQASKVDYLTKIYNRRGFTSDTDRLAGIYPPGTPVAALMIDVDNFKPYNDNYGHDKGDRCLESIAKVFSQTLYREDQVLARFGGEEFAVAMYGYGDNEAMAIAERLRTAVEALEIPHQYSRTGTGVVTISLGMHYGTAADSKALERLLKLADKNLYQSKARGGNQLICSREPEQKTGGGITPVSLQEVT